MGTVGGRSPKTPNNLGKEVEILRMLTWHLVVSKMFLLFIHKREKHAWFDLWINGCFFTSASRGTLMLQITGPYVMTSLSFIFLPQLVIATPGVSIEYWSKLIKRPGSFIWYLRVMNYANCNCLKQNAQCFHQSEENKKMLINKRVKWEGGVVVGGVESM